MMKFLVVYVVAILATSVSCRQHELYEIPECSIIGGDYTTFDRKEYSFSEDTDAHYLLKGDELIVEVDNRCHGTCSVKLPRALTIRTQHFKITLRKEIHVNGAYKDLPWKTAFPQDIGIKKTATNELIVDLWNGLLINWKQGTFNRPGHVFIRVPTSKAQLYMMMHHGFKGMCGIFNNNPSDDFTCPRGLIAPSVSYFAREWRTNDDELPAVFRH